MTDWKKEQDSLRNILLQGKPNAILKESFLQEMYIRNVITVLHDSACAKIPFDLHGPDCGAPDCYVTEIRFRIHIRDTFRFPRELPFTENEHGCVPKAHRFSGVFQLREETESHVIYYSAQHKRTLVLFRSYPEQGTAAFYFTGQEANRINGQNVHTLTQDYREDDPHSIYPFMSWALTTAEYAHFMD